MERIILHSDLDSFYASVETLRYPHLANVPMAVCGDPKKRHGVVLARNILASSRGVKTGEPVWQSKRKCPNLVCVPPHHEDYSKFSKLIRDVYCSYSPLVEPFGLDECWIDLTGSEHLFGTGEEAAYTIKERIKREYNLTVSVGVSFNKIFAKLGSDLKKPDGVTVISKENFREKIWDLPARSMLYVGKATMERLEKIGIFTIGDIANSDVALLERKLGKGGLQMYRYANGLDDAPVQPAIFERVEKSIGNSTTMPKDVSDEADIKPVLFSLSEQVGFRMRSHHLQCNTVTLSLRTKDFKSYERQKSLDFPICSAQDLFENALELYRKHRGTSSFRSIGVRATDLEPQDMVQFSMLPEHKQTQKNKNIDDTVDKLREKYGFTTVQRGVTMQNRDAQEIVDRSKRSSFPSSHRGAKEDIDKE